MKKSFRSLRSPNRKRKQATVKHGRTYSEMGLSVSAEARKYPGKLVMHCILFWLCIYRFMLVQILCLKASSIQLLFSVWHTSTRSQFSKKKAYLGYLEM